MWSLVTDDDRRVSERGVLWPDLPVDIVIEELAYLPARGKAAVIRGCEAYGFQRFRIDHPGLGVVGAGAQLIGVKGDKAIIVEFNEATGDRRQTTIPRSELTYAPELLRHGRG